MSEIELKFLLEPGAADQLRGRLRNFKSTAQRSRTRTLRSVYFDTADGALQRAGIALRLRRDGRRWIQTVKSKGRIHGGLSQTGETECPAPGGRLNLDAIPDEQTRIEVKRWISGRSLQPVCETRIRRTAREVPLEDGSRAEIAVDVGEIRSDEKSAPFSEAEIELLEGKPRALFDLAHQLFPEGGLSFSRLSKAARGYMLAAEGRIDTPLVPRNAKTVALAPTQTTEEAAREVLRECFDQIATNINVVRVADDPEGPHQLRIGLRRLRSALSIFGDALACPELDRLAAEARWLGQEVGLLRDADVALIDIVRPEATRHGDEPGFAILADALETHAAALRAILRKNLVGRRAQAFVLDLAAFIETRGWLMPEDITQTARLAQPIEVSASQALDRRWTRTRARARKIAKLSVEQRHALRKELKKLRYTVEFLGPLFPAKHVTPFLQHLKSLQDVFGDLNDASMVHALLTGPDAPGAGNPDAQRACGWVIGVRLARAELAWADAKSLWQGLARSRLFWRKPA